jgi:hypothetical protein
MGDALLVDTQLARATSCEPDLPATHRQIYDLVSGSLCVRPEAEEKVEFRRSINLWLGSFAKNLQSVAVRRG